MLIAVQQTGSNSLKIRKDLPFFMTCLPPQVPSFEEHVIFALLVSVL